jgi:hypothetical protein
MTKRIQITLSDVLKKDLKVLGFLILNGGVVYLSQTLLKENIALSVVFGAAANYVAFRLQEELSNSGYREALKK